MATGVWRPQVCPALAGSATCACGSPACCCPCHCVSRCRSSRLILHFQFLCPGSPLKNVAQPPPAENATDEGACATPTRPLAQAPRCEPPFFNGLQVHCFALAQHGKRYIPHSDQTERHGLSHHRSRRRPGGRGDRCHQQDAPDHDPQPGNVQASFHQLIALPEGQQAEECKRPTPRPDLLDVTPILQRRFHPLQHFTLFHSPVRRGKGQRRSTRPPSMRPATRGVPSRAQPSNGAPSRRA